MHHRFLSHDGICSSGSISFRIKFRMRRNFVFPTEKDYWHMRWDIWCGRPWTAISTVLKRRWLFLHGIVTPRGEDAVREVGSALCFTYIWRRSFTFGAKSTVRTRANKGQKMDQQKLPTRTNLRREVLCPEVHSNFCGVNDKTIGETCHDNNVKIPRALIIACRAL